MLDEMAYIEQTTSKYKNILEYKNPFLLNAWIKWGRNEKKNKWVIVSKTMANFEICTSISLEVVSSSLSYFWSVIWQYAV